MARTWNRTNELLSFVNKQSESCTGEGQLANDDEIDFESDVETMQTDFKSNKIKCWDLCCVCN